MANELAQLEADTLSALILNGDLGKLTEPQRLAYYKHRCEAQGLDPGTKPFDLIQLSGKLTLYATKECASQLSDKKGVSAVIVKEETTNGIIKVTARASTKDGRQTDDIGCVNVANLAGDQLCNAIMKCYTKAKRRAILTHCGLGMLDESELETVKDMGTAKIVDASKKGTEKLPVYPPWDAASGFKAGDRLSLDAHACQVCGLYAYYVREASAKSQNAGRLMLVCGKEGCKSGKYDFTMNGWVDEVMPHYERDEQLGIWVRKQDRKQEANG